MAYKECSDHIRITLVVLSALSFLPQLIRLRSKKNTTGFSVGYVLLNLFAATEQLTVDFSVMIMGSVYERAGAGESFTHAPPSTGDWLNFAQVMVVWFMFNILFAATLYYQPTGRRIGGFAKTYIIYLFISLVPDVILVGTIFVSETKHRPRQDLIQAFWAIHVLLLNPVAAFLTIVSALCETGPVWRHPGPESALSPSGLFIQCLVFAGVAASWVWRVAAYTRSGKSFFSPEWEWYFEYGWPVIGNAFFAGVQGVLFLCVLYNRWKKWRKEIVVDVDADEGTAGEREPLLSG
ncbi:PQ-loop repeat-containing protein [Aspergillus undulatus]|uniref:PQ-loop repeat-containing protein n=1 Tax=Aspergillus undulatus TaxID=1810928 RepID=UPI003CCDB1A7